LNDLNVLYTCVGCTRGAARWGARADSEAACRSVRTRASPGAVRAGDAQRRATKRPGWGRARGARDRQACTCAHPAGRPAHSRIRCRARRRWRWGARVVAVARAGTMNRKLLNARRAAHVPHGRGHQRTGAGRGGGECGAYRIYVPDDHAAQARQRRPDHARRPPPAATGQQGFPESESGPRTQQPGASRSWNACLGGPAKKVFFFCFGVFSVSIVKGNRRLPLNSWFAENTTITIKSSFSIRSLSLLGTAMGGSCVGRGPGGVAAWRRGCGLGSAGCAGCWAGRVCRISGARAPPEPLSKLEDTPRTYAGGAAAARNVRQRRRCAAARGTGSARHTAVAVWPGADCSCLVSQAYSAQ